MYRSRSGPERLSRTGACPYLEMSYRKLDLLLKMKSNTGICTVESWYRNGTTSLDGTGVRGRLGAGLSHLPSTVDTFREPSPLVLVYEFDLCSFPWDFMLTSSLPGYSSPKNPCSFLCKFARTTLPLEPLLLIVVRLAREGRRSSFGYDGSLPLRSPVPLLGLKPPDGVCEFIECVSLFASSK